MDLSAALLNGAVSPRTQWFYSGRATAFRSGSYKIHISTKDRSSDPDTRKPEPATKHQTPLLYNLDSDMGEQENIATNHPEVVERLLREMNAFRKGT